MSAIPDPKIFPFAPGEALTRAAAAVFVGRDAQTIDAYCRRHGIGRAFLGRRYISKAALAMLAAGDHDVLAVWRAGDRSSPQVVAYYDQHGIALPAIAGE